MPKFFNKKVFIISIIALSLFIIVGLAFYLLSQKQKAQIPVKSQEEILVEKQLKELDELRQKAGGQPLSQEQIQKQLEELDKLRSAQ